MTKTPRRTIVVDDDEQIRQILLRLLPSAGLEVCAELSSGEDAVQWMTDNEADVVVMDIQMPGIGGVEATRLIKEAKPDTVIFGFTGWGQQDIDAILEAGAAEVFEKTKIPELLEAIRSSG